MLTYPWKCTVLHCNHLGNTWKPLVLMTRHFDYCPSASEGDNQSVRSSAPVVSRCFPRGYNVKLYISRGRLAWWLLAFLHSGGCAKLLEKDDTVQDSVWSKEGCITGIDHKYSIERYLTDVLRLSDLYFPSNSIKQNPPIDQVSSRVALKMYNEYSTCTKYFRYVHLWSCFPLQLVLYRS